jgi:hypothetical protein
MASRDNPPPLRSASDPPPPLPLRPPYVPPYYPPPRNWTLVSLVALILLAGIAFALLMWLTPPGA